MQYYNEGEYHQLVEKLMILGGIAIDSHILFGFSIGGPILIRVNLNPQTSIFWRECQ